MFIVFESKGNPRSEIKERERKVTHPRSRIRKACFSALTEKSIGHEYTTQGEVRL